MRYHSLVLVGGVLAASPLAAQESPFSFTGGSVKSAYIVYDLMSKGKAIPGATYESGVAGDRWILRVMMPMDLGGKKDTVRTLAVSTRDSVYKYTAWGHNLLTVR